MCYLGLRTESKVVSRSLFNGYAVDDVEFNGNVSVDSGSDSGKEYSDDEELGDGMGGLFTEAQLEGMCEVFAAHSELSLSPIKGREGLEVEVVSPVGSAQKILECLASQLVLRSMSEEDSCRVGSAQDGVKLSTLLDEYGYELPVVRVPRVSVDVDAAGFTSSLNESIEVLVAVGRRGILKWSNLAVKAKTLGAYEGSFKEWYGFLEEHAIFNPFLLGCSYEVQVCVFAAFLVAKFQQKPGGAAGCITNLKFTFNQAVMSTGFMNDPAITRIANGFANYAHMLVNPRTLVVKSEIDVDIIVEGWKMVDEGLIISYGTGNRIVAKAVKVMAMVVATLNMHFGFRISQSQPRNMKDRLEGKEVFEVDLWFLEEDVLFLVKMGEELVLFTWREYYKLASVARVACPVKKMFFQVANTKTTHRSGTRKSKVAMLPQVYQLSSDVLGEWLIMERVLQLCEEKAKFTCLDDNMINQANQKEPFFRVNYYGGTHGRTLYRKCVEAGVVVTVIRASAVRLKRNPMSYATHGCRAGCVTTIKSQDRAIMRVTGHSTHTSFALYDRSMVMEGALSNSWECQATSEMRLVRERFQSLARVELGEQIPAVVDDVDEQDGGAVEASG